MFLSWLEKRRLEYFEESSSQRTGSGGQCGETVWKKSVVPIPCVEASILKLHTGEENVFENST